MNRIQNFSEFNSLYEAKIYDKTLELIITTILNAYTSELEYPAKSYSAIKSDIDSIKSATLEDKANAFVKIMNNVKNASADNKIEGAKEAVDAWVAAGTKATEAIKAMIAKYKDSKEESDYIKKFIETQLDEYFEEVKGADEENELKKDIAGANESNIHLESDEIFEGFLQGKKGRIEDVAKQITLVNAKLASLAQIPGMEDEVQKLQSEVNQISAKMGDLLTKKNKDINKQDIIDASERLAQIPGELDKVAEEMLKQDSTNKEASAILVQALLLAQEATNKEIEYLKKKGEAEEKVRSEKIQVQIDGDYIEYEQDQMNVPNPQVKKFQDLVIDSFKNIKSVTDLPFYKKMGNSGKYGPNTRDMVKFLKAGFGLKDKSGDITKELIDEIQVQKDTIHESVSSRIYSFSTYVNISEAAFNLTKALEFAKNLPTYKSKGSSGSSGDSRSSKSSGSSESSPYKEGLTGGSVTAIQLAIEFPESSEEYKSKKFGPETKKALIEWQKKNGIDGTGIAGEKTLQKMSGISWLGPWSKGEIDKMLVKITGTPYKEGLTGGSVSAIQNAIKFPESSEEYKSKKFGPETKKALIEWQKKNGINPTGTADEETLKKVQGISWLGPWSKGEIDKMLAKITGIPVKKEEPKVKDLTEEEFQEALKSFKIGYMSAGGTDEQALEDGIMKLKTINDIKKLDGEINKTKNSYGYSNLQDVLDGELGETDLETTQRIKKHLESIKGVTMKYDNTGRAVRNIRITY